MDTEKINKIYELSKKKENLESLLKIINSKKAFLKVVPYGTNPQDVAARLYGEDYITAQPYLEELMKRFVTMVLVDISDIETELEGI